MFYLGELFMEFETIVLYILLWATTLLIGWFFLYRFILVQLAYKHRKKQSKQLRFLQVKISKNAVKTTETDSWETATSMKQNIEIMNQMYKNFYALFEDGFKYKILGNNYACIEMFIEKETIKFIFAIPYEHLETFEKMVLSFFPGAITDFIEQPKFLETGKYMYGWEFFLNKDNVFPIRTYESFEADPMDSLLSAYSKVFHDEKLCLQILLEPLQEDLFTKLREDSDKIKKKQKSFLDQFFQLFKSDEKKEEKEEKNYDFSQNQVWDIDKKFNDEIFSVKIRALATSPSSSRPKKIIDDLAKSFFQYNYTGLNGFKFKPATDIVNFSNLFVERAFWSNHYSNIIHFHKKNILNIKELSSLIHFPHPKFNKNSRIKRQAYKTIPAPDTLPAEWITLAYNVYWWIKKEIKLTPKDRMRHVYILGQTGTGKTTIMLAQMYEDLQQGNWFTFLDPHGEGIDTIMQHFPKERIDDLIYFDLSNTEYPIAFNPLDWAHNDDERDVITNDLIEMFVSMYGEEIFGPRIQDYFRNACFLLMEQEEWWTLVDIMRLFTDDAYAESKIRNVKNPVIAAWWNKTYKKMGDREKAEIIPFIQAKFAPFTTSTYVRNIIGQPKSAFNFDEAMQEKKVILVKLAKGLVGEINSQLIGRMVSMQLKLAALRRAGMAEPDRVPHFLYIDEFQNYVSQSIESILSEARKYKLWLTIAHQYIDQLKKEWLGGNLDLSKTIFGNVWSMFIFKVGAPDAEFLQKEMEPEFSQNDLVNTEAFMGACKVCINWQQSRPFSFKSKIIYESFGWPKPLNTQDKIAIMQQISALKWWTKRELVDKEIYFRVGV